MLDAVQIPNNVKDETDFLPHNQFQKPILEFNNSVRWTSYKQ